MKKIIASISTILAIVTLFAFTITANASETVDITSVVVTQDNITYTGSEIVPTFSVYDKDGNEVQNSQNNFTCQATNNVNAGTATITIKGKGNYSGTVSTNFEIKPRSIKDVKIEVGEVFLGSALPIPVLTYNTNSLTSGVDYNCTTTKATKAGIYSVYTITGTGNYTDSVTVNRVTRPRPVANVKLVSKNGNSVTVKWDSQANEGTTKYIIYKSDANGNIESYYCESDTNSATIYGYYPGDITNLVIRGYVMFNGCKYYGQCCDVFSNTTALEQPNFEVITKSADRSYLILNWSMVNSNGYQIIYTTDPSFRTGVKNYFVNSAQTTAAYIKVPVSNSVYYARIRPYRDYLSNGKVVPELGPWTNILSTQFNKVYATYKTKYVKNANRTTNLKLAAAKINGTIVRPGETFSFNKVVGQRTAAKGYKKATIFTGSKSKAQEIGGGICQVASTLYNTALISNMGIVQRAQHSQRVTYCPLGRDAAIYWGSQDFKFKNTCGYPIRIEMSVVNGYVYCTFKVCYNVAPPKVTLNVSRSGKNFTLRRYVYGKVNYTAKSRY